ncbi:MAG TPA: cation diffusion facilitator family transporter [Gammaproteobacteria bacterium]|nr:cation diffusion facilitator family transporter [Gammaproteobacteria bacterium]
MSHSHSHPHNHASGSSWRFSVGIGLNLVIVAGETIAALAGNSTALLADAGHNLTDVLSLVLAGGAIWLAQRPANDKRTYGFRRATILAALANALLLIIMSVLLAAECIDHLVSSNRVNEPLVIGIAALAVVVNGATALLFMRGRKQDINLRGAFLHMLSDAALSAGVILAAVGIMLTGWQWLDPSMGLIIVIVILWSTWSLLRESFDLSLDAVPPGIDPDAIRDALLEEPKITEVHHLHVWAMSTTEVALTAHLVKPDGQLDDALLSRLEKSLSERFGIRHIALQLEHGGKYEGCPAGTPG